MKPKCFLIYIGYQFQLSDCIFIWKQANKKFLTIKQILDSGLITQKIQKTYFSFSDFKKNQYISLHINFNRMSSNPEFGEELYYEDEEYSSNKAGQTNTSKANDVESRLKEFLDAQDLKILMEITKMNGGDAGKIFAIMKDRIKVLNKVQEFKKLKEEVQKSIKSEINDRAKLLKISQQFKNQVKRIIQACAKIEFTESTLLPNLKKDLSSALLNNTSNFINILLKTCDGGLTYEEVDEQIKKVIELTLPGRIKNKGDLIKSILEKKNFSSIYQIQDANKAEQKRIVTHLQCLKSLQIFLKYGKQFSTAKNKFVMIVAESIAKVSSDWQVISSIIEKIVEDPLHDFSKQQYPTKILELIYRSIYKMKQFEQYVKLINNGDSLKTKQGKDVERILFQISDRLRPHEENELRKCLQEYSYLNLYKNDNVGVHRMLKIHKFIQENCKNYLEYEKVKENNFDQKKPNLIILLRIFLLDSKIPFVLHSEIEEKVFLNQKYDLLDSQLSKNQKKDLFKWMKTNMKSYYQYAYYGLSLRDETKQKLIDIIIRLDLNILYSHIQQSIEDFLMTISPNCLFQSKCFSQQQRQKIYDKVIDNQVVKKYVESAGLDVNKLEFQATQIIFYDIVIPNQIGCLHNQTTKKFIISYLKNPEQQTVRKADIINSQKQIFLAKVQEINQLKDYRQNMRVIRSKDSIRKFKSRIQEKIGDPGIIDLVWGIYQRSGKLQFGQSKIQPEDDTEISQLNENLDPQMFTSLKQLQQSEEYHQFKFGYPELAKQKYKQAEETLIKKARAELKKSLKLTPAPLEQFIKKLQSQKCNVESLLKQAKFKRSAELVSKLPEYKDYINFKESNQRQGEFIEKIQKQKQLKDLLKREDFLKYEQATKDEVINLFRRQGKDFIYSLGQIILKKDLELIKSEMFPGQEIILQSPPAVKSGGSNQKKGNLSVESWKKKIQKNLNCKFADIITQFRLFEPTVRSELDGFEKKMQIIEQYEKEIIAIMAIERKNMAERMKKNDESNIKQMEIYLEKQKDQSQVSLLVDFYEKDLNYVKEKYNIKLMAPKFNRIKEELKGYQQFEKILKLSKELDQIQKYQKQA